MPNNELVQIGRVVGAHGVRGLLKVLPLTDFPERFDAMESLSLYRNGQKIGCWKIVSRGELTTKGLLLLGLEGICDRTSADLLSQCDIMVPFGERMQLDQGQYWVDDLIGFEVCDDRGTPLGSLTAIERSGASDLLEISDSQGKTHLVPMVEDFVRQVDEKGRRIVLHLIEGLW